jgi:peptidoglycan hydrolase-like protein with peptidoglycan-binding domain
VFSTFSAKATNYLTSVWDDTNVDPGNAFATAVSNKVSSIVSNIKQNVETAKGYLQDMYDVRDSSVYNPPSGGGGGGGGGGEILLTGDDVSQLQQILNKFFSAKLTVNGVYDAATKSAVANMQSWLSITPSGLYDKKTKDAMQKWLNARPVGSWFKQVGFGIPAAMYAKGTTGTPRDEWAITNEPQFGDELTMYATPEGTLSFMRAGSTVIPADITKNLVEWGQFTPDSMNLGGGVNVNMINNAVNKPEFNFTFDALVKAERIDENTLPEVKRFVQQEINSLVKQMNYAIKGKGGR